MEQIDILTSEGEKTGKYADRAVVHSKGLWHRTVHIWMRNSSGELLLQKRSDTKETHPGLWDISCAGHLSAGDSSTAGAVREAKEELGVLIDATNLRYLFTLKQHWESHDRKIIENEIKDIYLYTIPIEPQDVHPDGNEVSEIRFLSVENIKKQQLINMDKFVPHEEEYRRLFEIVESL